MISVEKIVNSFIKISGNLKFAGLIILAMGYISDNISSWISLSVRRFDISFSNCQKEIHEEVLFRDIINEFQMDPIKEDYLKLIMIMIKLEKIMFG
jgi:hypothetical protein